jgi:FAD/FMN-containing dehydrogenase
MSLAIPAFESLRASFGGQLVGPADAAFDTLRRVHNGMIDRRPAVIAQCRGAADVVDAIRAARESNLEIAVRGGGHNVGGRGTIDAGVLIDLSLLRQVNVDPAARRAWVGGGALWRDFNRETQLHGLATTGGVVSSTGVAGLTLGGGLGWLMPKHAMALDNLVSAQLVLADGRVVKASADDHPDLFWAIRGGGGNFGVATTFEFRLHPVGPIVTAGLVAHPFDRARDVLRFFRDHAASVSDDVMLVAALISAPDGSGQKLAAIAAVHVGTVDEGAAALAPIKAFGPPVMDVIGPMPYSAANAMLDASLPAGARNYWKSHFFAGLTNDAIDALVDSFASAPSPMCQIIIEHFHGAATRIAPDATAYCLRRPGFNLLILGQWMDPAGDAAGTTWCRTTEASLQSFRSRQRYMNYLDRDDAGEDGLTAAYGNNLPRLRAIKKRYDPDNVFRQNVNIEPA